MREDYYYEDVQVSVLRAVLQDCRIAALAHEQTHAQTNARAIP